MKRIKINKCLLLLFVAVCSMLFMTSLTAFAAHTDGSTKVNARIEVDSTETTQLVTGEDSNYNVQDESNVLTGDAVYACTVIALFVLMISILVIFLCINNKSIDKENKAN